MLAGDPTEAAEKAEEFLKERSLSYYDDEVALKGLQLAQADAERGSLDRSAKQRSEMPLANSPMPFPIATSGHHRRTA